MSTESTEKQQNQQVADSSSSSLDSTSNSVSLIKLDELSSFGATKQARLPALIKLNPLADQNSRPEAQQAAASRSSNSMPDFSGSQLEKSSASSSAATQQSLPATLQQPAMTAADKENEAAAATATATATAAATGSQKGDDSIEGFQVVDMEAQLVGPSLPAPTGGNLTLAGQDQSVPPAGDQLLESSRPQQYASHLGDSLIEMIINLRNENQNLVKALEVNNSYVKERLDEFKRCQEEAKRRELEHQEEKGELEHQLRKVQRQNGVLSERLKSMEQKLKEMRIEVSGSLAAAHSSKASSIQGEQQAAGSHLYPQLADSESFSNVNQPETTTMQIDVANSELNNDEQQQQQQQQQQHHEQGPATPTAPMDTDTVPKTSAAEEVGAMDREQLSKRFDAKKVDFYAIDDPMKQCDQLEQQLNDIGRRDYEICLLQQQLNIYRRDFRLERMAKLEAKLQIERLKGEIDRLCLDRLSEQQPQGGQSEGEGANQPGSGDNLIGKLGHHLSRRALKSAAKAAKYASKQAHLEEKAAAALARAAAAKASAAGFMQPQQPGGAQPEVPELAGRHRHRGHHSHHSAHHHHHHHAPPHSAHHKQTGRSIRGEIVNDLMSTANKAMLTGYNLASTTINSALDKLSQFEQQQAAQATNPNRPRPGVSYPNPEMAAAAARQQQQQQQQQQQAKPSAPPMDSHLSVD